MPNRFRLRTALGTALAAVSCLLLCASADAAVKPPQTLPVPADAPTVATTPSGVALIAWVVGGRTCTVVQDAGAPRPTTMRGDSKDGGSEVNGICVTTPVLSQFYAQALWTSLTASRHSVVWGVAGPGAARLELREGPLVLSASPTAPAPLPGPAAGLRFWALETQAPDAAQETAGPQPDEVALLDATGAVRRAWPPLGLGLSDREGLGLRTERDGTSLQRGRLSDGASWQLRRTVTPRLVPTPLRPERRVDVRCLRLLLRYAGGGVDDGGPCDDDLRLVAPLVVQQGRTCVGIHVLVVARAPVRSAVVVLGDGTRRTVTLHALGGAPGAVGGVLVVEPGMAIRRLDGLGAGGEVVRRWPIEEPPVRRDAGCSGIASTVFATDELFDQAETLGAGPHVAHVFDHDDELCAAVDRAPRVPQECAVPPVDPESSSLRLLGTTRRSFLYGIVSAEVAAARVTFADGTTQTVPATAIPGYAGQYANAVAQIALDVPVGRRLRSSVLLDVHGRVVSARQGLITFEQHVGRPVTLRPARDGLPAMLATPVSVGSGGRPDRFTCVSLGSPPSIALSCDFGAVQATGGAATIQVLARCAPRRMVVRGVLRRSTDRLVVRTRDGREIVAASFRIPDRAGPGAGRYVALAVLGPHEAIADIRLRGKAARRLPYAYPATAGQCGYSDQPETGLAS